MREPSGENTGCSLLNESRVSWTGSPLGKSFMYTCPRSAESPKVPPRMNVSMRPSADNAGATAESLKSVSWMGCAGADRSDARRKTSARNHHHTGDNERRGDDPHCSRVLRPGRHFRSQGKRNFADVAEPPLQDPSPSTAEARDEPMEAFPTAAQSSRVRVQVLRQWNRETVAPGERPFAAEHFEEHAAKRPDVGALVDRLPAGLFRAHVRGGPDDGASRVASPVRVDTEGATAASSTAFARPKSRTFTTPAGVTLMFAGLRSR